MKKSIVESETTAHQTVTETIITYARGSSEPWVGWIESRPAHCGFGIFSTSGIISNNAGATTIRPPVRDREERQGRRC